jgi:hypothetical protein
MAKSIRRNVLNPSPSTPADETIPENGTGVWFAIAVEKDELGLSVEFHLSLENVFSLFAERH